MEELEKFSLSNQNPKYKAHNTSHAVMTEEDTIDDKESSLCESELEFALNGNIRACAYKRDEENQR